MSEINTLLPRQPVPGLSMPLVGGGQWSLPESPASNFTMVVFYRGLHCPICKAYLGELENLLPEFEERGVDTIAISSDGIERAGQSKADWKLPNLKIGYDLPLDVARQWGLYVSTSRGATSVGVVEPELFSEPGLYLVRADGTLYFGTVQTMPFARPRFADILPALDFVLKNDYPARGEVASIKG